MAAQHRGRPARIGGFTLVELLVALVVMALLAIMSWRGLDGMARAQEQTKARSDEVLALQAGLAQWTADLDAVTAVQRLQALDWDGRALRITRRGSGGDADGLRVVAWARGATPTGLYWLRWESLPLTTRGEWEDAWQQAALWAQNPGEAQRARQVAVAALAEWQIYYYRNNAWSNPLSSEGTAATIAGANGIPTVPDGVRLVLVLSPGQAISGPLVRDWVGPTVGGGKS